MFILYSLVIGMALGLALGGRASGLTELTFRWRWAVLAGIVTQVLLFSTPLNEVVGTLGPPIYVASTALVLAAIIVNWRITGMPVIALGALSNLTAIIANRGYMPADPGAMASLGQTISVAYSNSVIVSDPALRPLTDIFALPGWLPFANVYSIGDILIATGIVIVIVAAMRRASSPAGTGSDSALARRANRRDRRRCPRALTRRPREL
jgi:hypothetical protein